MNPTLIPFGIDLGTGELIDVADAPRGRDCNCKCPSCGAPLIARKGEEKQWHFAHASRGVYQETVKECENSFFVSVRMMARQVVGESLTLKLPEYRGLASLHIEEVGCTLSESFLVAQGRKVAIQNIRIEAPMLSTVVDVAGTVEGYPFALYFTHPGRPVPAELSSQSERCGVVRISLDNCYFLIMTREDGLSYQQRLRRYLEEDETSKSWVFHPRYASRHAAAASKLSQQKIALLAERQAAVQRATTRKTSQTIERPERQKVKVQCVLCGNVFNGFEPGRNDCPTCGTHINCRSLGPVHEQS